ncbi:NUDIX domain-containing protein [Streptomyces qinglanensis]|uniref:NUDIX domain-containing protein n=1 Tax=Streptomyces qinglanensis TaxID=943816 RepID=UPI0009A05F2D|nr:NUDIX domain-containing protein [Streptomyces qinglanensis]
MSHLRSETDPRPHLHNLPGDDALLTRPHIRATLEAYLTRHPQEQEALAGLAAALDDDADPTSRSTLPGHITCGAVVIDRDRRVLHVGHRTSGGKLLAPGGHTEAGDRTLLTVALRKVQEETGIRPEELCMTPQFLSAPIDIDVHDIDPNTAKGEPAHQHYDFRFAFYLAAEQPPPLALQDEEVSEARWLPYADVRSPTLCAKLLLAEGDGLDGQPEPVGASALIHDGHGQYLLHLRDQRDDIAAPGAFSLLGGGREEGDTCLAQTLRRELAEEVPGIAPAELTPYAVAQATGAGGLTAPIQIFAGRWDGDPDAIDLREGVLLRWFTPEVLDRLRLSPDTHELIHRHAAQHPPTSPPGEPVRSHRGEAPEGTELHIVGVHLYLQNDHGRILLGLRHPDSTFAPNTWHFLAGHCEREAAITCLVREAKEEAGLLIDPGDVELVHLVHLVNSPGAPPRIQLVFRARSWSGTPKVLEPDRCVEWRWWAPKDLPTETVPYTRLAIDGVLVGCPYSQMGWE